MTYDLPMQMVPEIEVKLIHGGVELANARKCLLEHAAAFARLQ